MTTHISNKTLTCILLLFGLFVNCRDLVAQSNQGKTLAIVDSVNRLVDRAVVKKDSATMEKHFAADFFFLHSTGMTDTKKSWLKSALSPQANYASREHDSIKVDLHPDLAVVSGLLTVRLKSGSGKAPYRLRYIRVYARRNNIWQLVSHHSTAEVKVK